MQNHRSCNSWLSALGLCFLFAPGCDAPDGEEELAQDLLAEEEDEEIEQQAVDHPETVDGFTTELQPELGANFFLPVGVHDATNCNAIAGWAKDGDTTLPTYVSIYKGAAYPAGTWVANVYAGNYRPDLPFVDKYHGFSLTTPSAFKTGVPETIYIHAVNIDTDGNWVAGADDPLLKRTGLTFCCLADGSGACPQ